MRDRTGLVIVVGSVLLTIYYLVALYRLADGLSFYWDDYFIIIGQSKLKLVDLLLSGINGNWWPLSSLILIGESWLFHLWYPGYLLVNGALILLGALFLGLIVKCFFPRQNLAAFIAATIYATSIQSTINATVITPSWPLSTTLALAAAYVFISRRRSVLLVLLLLLSFLAMSGMFIVNASLTAGVILAHDFKFGSRTRSALIRAVALLCAGVAGTGVGAAISSSRSVNGLASAGISETISKLSITEVARSTLGLVLSWTAMPVIPGSYVNSGFNTWFSMNVHLRAFAIFGFILILAILVWLLLGSRLRTEIVRQSANPLMLLAFLIPVIDAGLTLSIFRSGNPFSPRYGILWIPPTLLITVALADSLRGKRTALLDRSILILISLSAALGVLMLPSSLVQAANADRDRIALSEKQNLAIRACQSGRDLEPVVEISPSISKRQLCEFVNDLAQ